MPQLAKPKSGQSIPATIRRPGAETKVGGSPFTTMGLKLLPPLSLILPLLLRPFGVEAVEVQQHTAPQILWWCVRKYSDCGGNEETRGKGAIYRIYLSVHGRPPISHFCITLEIVLSCSIANWISLPHHIFV